MIIQFRTSKLRKLCNNFDKALGAWGHRRAEKVRQRLDEIDAATTLEDLRGAPGDCHIYKGSRDYALSLDLDGGYRLLFRPIDDPIPMLSDDKSLDWSRVTAVEIIDVRDPHG